MNRNFAKGLAISLLLMLGISSCDPAQAATFDSQPGQTMDQFVVSIRKDLSALSRAHGSVEVCGGIVATATGYTVELVPGEHYRCEFPVPEGYTGTSIHTHPYDSAPGFSRGDYEAGPGYMVWRGNLKHQAGEGTERRVRD